MGKKGKEAVASPPPAEEEEVKPEEPIGDQLQGDFIFADGSTYKGGYLKKGDDVCLNGEGLLQSGPEVFQGTFEKGQYKVGKYTSCNGAVYVGHFHENSFHGLGEYTWPDGRSYKGMWKNGYMHGSGQFINFSFGVHKVSKGFSFEGKFSSRKEEQQKAKQSYLAEYGSDYTKSATAALQSMGERSTGAEACKDFFVLPIPLEGEEKPEAAAERAAAEELVLGSFPEVSAVQVPALQAFVAQLAEGAEKPLQTILMEDKNQTDRSGPRLRHEQLQHVGQGVEFLAPEAEVGQLRCLGFINISSEFNVAAAKWKLIYSEEVPAPA
mmetsp:Transcript_17023/g.31921  ORF Transcript_17023/g.31921 Transcript_17023/m.31921 type:complete len:324 (-) Transcript_17023:130-1101(-)